MAGKKSKVVLITGAGRGIGRAIALNFAQHGFKLGLVSRTKKELDEVSDKGKKFGIETLVLVCDIGDEKMVQEMVEAVAQRFGKIDILVNNAGCGIKALVEDNSLKSWEAVIRTNLTGTFLCCKYVLPFMLKQKNGSIINVSSIHGQRGFAAASAYSASKAGIIGFTKSLAMEVKDYDIRVNAICPGMVDTDFIKGTRAINRDKLIKPADIAEVVFFLSSDSASAISGQAISVLGTQL